MKEQRKLAAIMFTDIVGYSALMSRDEKVAFQILVKNRNIHKTAIAKFNGEYIKEVGDGTLAIFQSSMDAVNCAIILQKECCKENSLRVRIGIHTGDIIVSEGDVFGDGVNVASRIEALGEPGGIYISEKVYDDIKNKPGIMAEFLGEKILKNIPDPVKIYSLTTGQKKPGIADNVLKDHRKSKEKSIAVLPFVDMSPEKGQEYFCDGITEEIINTLSHIESFKVIARTSAFAFKNKQVDMREIGRILDVVTLLEGSIRKAGSQLRITAQLIRVTDGSHIWSERYDRELKDVFAIQDEIASAIVEALKTKLLPEDKRQTEKKQTKDTEAYELFLKGRFYWNKRIGDALQKSIDFFSQAIKKDPDYAPAFAGLASAYVIFPEYSKLLPKDFYSKARIAAKKALEIDPSLAEPHAVLGLVKHQFEYDQVGAEIEFKSAIELDPGNLTTHQWYGLYFASMGRLDEFLAETRQAREIDPLSLIINNNIGNYLFLTQQYDLAADQFQKVIELDPNFSMAYFNHGLGSVYEAQGKFHEAMAMFQKARTILNNGPHCLSQIGCLYIKTRRVKKALKILDELLTYSGQGYQVSSDIASLYLSLGNKEKTFEWLWKSYEDREIGIHRLKFYPAWRSLNSDPRFIALLMKMGLE